MDNHEQSHCHTKYSFLLALQSIESIESIGWCFILGTCHLSSSAPKSCSKDDPPEEQNSGGSQRRQGPKGLQTAAVSNDHWLGCLAGLRAYSLDLLYNIHAICHTAEHHMLAIQPLSLHGAQEELRSIGVGSSVSHRQDSRSRVLEGKVLICKLRTIDGLTTSTIASCEVSTLRKLTIGIENGLARLQRQCCKTTQVPICINSWLNHWSHEFVLYKFWVQSFGRIWMGFGWLLLFSQSPPGTWNQGSRDGRQILWNEGVGQICPVPSLQCTSSGSSPRSLGRRQHEAPWWCGLPGCRRWSCPQVFCQDEIHENHENQKKKKVRLQQRRPLGSKPWWAFKGCFREAFQILSFKPHRFQSRNHNANALQPNGQQFNHLLNQKRTVLRLVSRELVCKVGRLLIGSMECMWWQHGNILSSKKLFAIEQRVARPRTHIRRSSFHSSCKKKDIKIKREEKNI